MPAVIKSTWFGISHFTLIFCMNAPLHSVGCYRRFSEITLLLQSGWKTEQSLIRTQMRSVKTLKEEKLDCQQWGIFLDKIKYQSWAAGYEIVKVKAVEMLLLQFPFCIYCQNQLAPRWESNNQQPTKRSKRLQRHNKRNQSSLRRGCLAPVEERQWPLPVS